MYSVLRVSTVGAVDGWHMDSGYKQKVRLIQQMYLYVTNLTIYLSFLSPFKSEPRGGHHSAGFSGIPSAEGC